MVQKGIKMDIIKKIAEELQIRPDQVQAVVNLIDEGNTIPFIARYRKEAHGALNDEILRNLDERLTYLRNLEEKKSSVLASMEELGVLTDDLKKSDLTDNYSVNAQCGPCSWLYFLRTTRLLWQTSAI